MTEDSTDDSATTPQEEPSVAGNVEPDANLNSADIDDELTSGGGGAEEPQGDALGSDAETDAAAANENNTKWAAGIRWARKWIGRPFLALLVVLVVMATWPVSHGGLGASPSATQSYSEAVSRFEATTTDESGFVLEQCRSQLLTHEETTDVVYVLFHGLTNCPKQFLALGNELFATGANVLILRAPGHGRTNAAGDAIGSVSNVGGVTSEKLRDYADESVDIAAGLGVDVRVIGVSMGGVHTVWAAQFRPEVSRAVAVAPAMMIPRTPGFATTAFTNFFNKIPNVALPGRDKLDHVYSGESTRALVAMFALGRATTNSIKDDGAGSSDLIVVINPDDNQVDSADSEALADLWEKHGGQVSKYFLPAIGLPHDVIDGDQTTGDPALVYPILRSLLETGAA